MNQLQLTQKKTLKKGPSHFRVMGPETENLPFHRLSNHPRAALKGKVMKQKKKQKQTLEKVMEQRFPTWRIIPGLVSS